MIRLGMTRKEYKALDRLLISSHRIKIKVVLMDLMHGHKEDLTEHFYDGLVSVDADADVTRALDLVLIDPKGKIDLDPNSPARTSIFIADMISIKYVVTDPLGTERFGIPIFCGPIDDVSRDDWMLNIKCLGKESLANHNVWKGKVYKEGQKRIEVIEDLVVNVGGETKAELESSKDAKLNGDLKIDQTENPIHEARKLARTMGLNLFWDGRGVAVLRNKKSSPVRPFLNSRWLTSRPKIDYDLSKTINAVRVYGKKRKGKPRIKAKAVAKRRHPLSPWRIGRPDAPRYLWKEIEDDSITTKKEAKQVAKRELKQGLIAGIDVTFEGIPHPRWEELDVVKVSLPEYSVKFPLRRFTIPLVAGDVATVGYLKRMRPKGGQRAGIRKNKGKGKDKK